METIAPNPQIVASTPCTHCQLPVGKHPVIEEYGVFCCDSCSWVSQLLSEEGFAPTYYKLTQTATKSRKRANVQTDALLLAALDDEQFIQKHSTANPDGSLQITLFLEGMYCAACVWLIEQMPQVVSGVLNVRADLSRARIHITWQPKQVQLSQAVKWLSQFGYTARPLSKNKPQHTAEKQLLVRMGVAWAIAGNIMLLAFALYSGLMRGSPRLAVAAQWMSLILAIPSILYGAQPFFQKASASIQLAFKTRTWSKLHMDVPIVIGISMGFMYSVFQTIQQKEGLWFDSLAVLTAALLTSRWLQARAHRFAQEAGEQLLTLLPQMARKLPINAIGNWNAPTEMCSVNILAKGDLLFIPAGEVFPTDGIVVAGKSKINNAILTGESRLIPIEIGDSVYAGSSNLTQSLQIRVTNIADESQIGQLLKWVGQNQEKVPRIVVWADQMGGYFIAAILLLSILCFGLWYAHGMDLAINHTVALLVITCPCALGMATPLAMAIGVGRAAKQGIFVKNSAYIQQIVEADTVVLDKTGTLTYGAMHVAQFEGESHALALAAAVEAQSQHPIASAFKPYQPANYHQHKATRVEVFDKAICGYVGEDEVWVGQPRFLGDKCQQPNAILQNFTEKVSQDGLSPVWIIVNQKLMGVVGVGDTLRPEAFTFVNDLKEKGKDVYLLSGDHQQTVEMVGKSLGLKVEHVVGNASPIAKKEFIEALIAKGKHPIMVGDGVNDAAALCAADVGIAMHSNANIGKVSADIFITQEGIIPLMQLFTSAPKVLSTVRFNLIFSLLYNLAGATAAIMGWVDPLIAAVAMPLSSATVVASSLLQKTFLAIKEPN